MTEAHRDSNTLSWSRASDWCGQRGVKEDGRFFEPEGFLRSWDMRCKYTFTVRVREGGTVTVYRTEGYNQPDIRQVGLTIEQGERWFNLKAIRPSSFYDMRSFSSCPC
jgi:hypothetical protein